MNTAKRQQLEERANKTRALLLKACRDHEVPVTADERVSETDAAMLLGCAPGSLKNKRELGTAPPFYRRAINNCRVSYRLEDLALWIENGREDW